ncbi:uncharacterized protein BXZ73DRAFT_61724 [Epithele typhae]|uniref:uncharacterized protein n=1 Tax=Epithele typhae TaxID=378194 RepID=UPI002008BD80|nr:uncharacterized protein BXZ73DRAFT_61724 [Epithele typhae]KAH9905090.1 hypothetical protein BXZ73DRAFT_61724 [Epithele typhae]
MKFLAALLLLAVAVALPVEACKCLGKKGHLNTGNTKTCCKQLNGAFRDGNDCEASTISEHLREFRSCCESHNSATSDCDFPP